MGGLPLWHHYGMFSSPCLLHNFGYLRKYGASGIDVVFGACANFTSPKM